MKSVLIALENVLGGNLVIIKNQPWRTGEKIATTKIEYGINPAATSPAHTDRVDLTS